MKILFSFAHPDDETIVAGGTIATLAKDKENKIILLCATKGDAGQLGEPPVTTKDKLGEIRFKELKEAAHVLGISKIQVLDFKDGTLTKNIKPLIEEITKQLSKEKPDVVVTFDDQGGWSNHPDHVAISDSTTIALLSYAKKASKKVRLYHSATPASEFKKVGKYVFSFGKIIPIPDNQVTTIVDITKNLKTKLKALKCHKSQHKDYERLNPYLSKAIKEHFRLIFESTI